MSDEAALREMQRTMLEMARAIGALESTVKSMTETWRTQDASASIGRRDLHQKFDGLVGTVSGLSGKVEKLIGEMAEIKPSVEAFEIAKFQAIGGMKLGRALWLALPFGGGGGLVWLLHHLWGPKPPLP